MNKDEKTEFCLKWIRRIKDNNATFIRDMEDSMRFYRGDPTIVTSIGGRSKVTTTDMMDAIEWIKPSLLEVFTAGDDVVSIQPVTKEDVVSVEKQNLLVNHQLKVKNNWFMILYDWFDDLLKFKLGILKYQWYRNTEYVEKEYEGLSDIEYHTKIAEDNVQVLSHEEVHTPETDTATGLDLPDEITHNLSIQYVIEDEYPLLEVVAPNDFGFMHTTKKLDNGLVYHRVRYTKSEFIDLFGKSIYEEVKHIDPDIDNIERERFSDLGGRDFFYNEENDEFVVYECYYTLDGIKRITTLCGDVLCDDIENKYNTAPFLVITPIKAAHRLCGFGFYDLLREIQKLRTSILRQILDNVYFANNRRYFVDPFKVNVDDLLNNNFPGAIVRTKNGASVVEAIKVEDKAPLPPEVFSFWEVLSTEKDYHSGVPRSFQGVAKGALTDTWRGLSKQISQASQRVAMIARIIAEMGISPLVSAIINMNIRFMKKSTFVRYMSDWVEISPDNSIGKFDVVVNVGIGTTEKEQTIMYIQQLLGLFAQCFKSGVPVVNSQNVYNALSALIKAMGFKNISDYISDPELNKDIQQLISMATQAGLMQNPTVAPLLQKVASTMGIQPQQQQISGKTYQGQETPAQAQQPQQPMNPTTTPMGGGFFG